MDSNEIVNGIAQILWGLAWADHVEQTGCQSLAGCQIENEMPEIGPAAYAQAWYIAGATEQHAGLNLWSMLYACLRADGVQDGDSIHDVAREHAERFGNCIAYEALGHGVSWFDDHAQCEAYKVPFLCVDVEDAAAEACPNHHDDRTPDCPDCGDAAEERGINTDGEDTWQCCNKDCGRVFAQAL